MSLRFETASKYQNSIIERIKADFRQMIQFHKTHEWMLERLSEQWNVPAYKALPAWRKSYIRGMYELLFFQLHEAIYIGPNKIRKALLEWVLVSPKTGKRYRTKIDDSWLKECDNEEKANMKGFHVWREAMDNGNWKPFNK